MLNWLKTTCLCYGLLAAAGSCPSAGFTSLARRADGKVGTTISTPPLSFAAGQYGIPAAPVAGPIRFGSGVAAAPDGSIYFAAFNSRSITRLAPGGGLRTVVNGLDCGPSHLSVDSQGNIFFTETPCGKVMEYRREGVLTTLASGCASPTGIATASNGDVYFVTEGGGLQVIHNGVVTTLLSGLSILEGLARDSRGDLFLASYGDPNSGQASGTVMKYSEGKLTTLIRTGLHRVRDLASDTRGNVYVIEESNYRDQGNSGALREVSARGAVTTLLYDIDYPEGLAVAADGSIYFAAERANTTDAGAVLFRYRPDFGSQHATPVGGGAHSPDAIIVGIRPLRSASIRDGALTYTVTAAHASSSEGFVLLSRSLVRWKVDTSANLPMPGSWSPLPAFAVTVDGRSVAATAYLMRAHQGQRWPSAIVNGIEIPATGFSEQPFGFVIAFPLVLSRGAHTIRVKGR